MKKFYTNKTIFLRVSLILTVFFFIILSYFRVIAYAKRTDSEHVKIYFTGYHQDYMQYLAGIVRGQHGYLWYQNPFSVPNSAKLPIYTLFTIAGFITKPLNLWPPIVFHGLHITTLLFAIGSIYYLARSITSNERWGIIATFISLIVTIPPDIFYSRLVAQTYHPWWTDHNLINRLSSLPHHDAALGFLCFSIAWYINFRKTKRYVWFVLSSLFASLCIFMVPQTLTPYIAIVLLGACVDGIGMITRKKLLVNEFFPLATLIIPFISILSIDRSLNIPLWIANREWELRHFSLDPWSIYHLYISYLFLIPTTYIGFIALAKKKDIRAYFLLLWILLPILFIPLYPILKIGSIRFYLFIHIIIPFSILSAVGIKHMISNTFSKILCIIYFAALLVYIPIHTYDYIQKNLALIFTDNLNTRFYPPKTYYELADWIDENIPANSTILSGEELGTLIVSKSPIFAYIGHQQHGSNWGLDSTNLQRFYNKEMSYQEAIGFLKYHQIQYVIKDPKYIWYNKDLTYPFLNKIWQHVDTGVYKVML